MSEFSVDFKSELTIPLLKASSFWGYVGSDCLQILSLLSFQFYFAILLNRITKPFLQVSKSSRTSSKPLFIKR